jgi:cell division protein FtsL
MAKELTTAEADLIVRQDSMKEFFIQHTIDKCEAQIEMHENEINKLKKIIEELSK